VSRSCLVPREPGSDGDDEIYWHAFDDSIARRSEKEVCPLSKTDPKSGRALSLWRSSCEGGGVPGVVVNNLYV
jgi:hypothetical protein